MRSCIDPGGEHFCISHSIQRCRLLAESWRSQLSHGHGVARNHASSAAHMSAFSVQRAPSSISGAAWGAGRGSSHCTRAVASADGAAAGCVSDAWWGVPCHSFPRATASAGAAQRSAAAHPGQRAHISGDAAELLGHDLQPTVGGRSMRREGRHGGLWACCARCPTGTALTQERIHLHGTAKNGTSQELVQ